VIYALGALGDPTELDRLNTMKNSNNEAIAKATKIARELYGKVDYDQIKSKVPISIYPKEALRKIESHDEHVLTIGRSSNFIFFIQNDLIILMPIS
jgi:hypothetical protein